jgi:hypothetical protein
MIYGTLDDHGEPTGTWRFAGPVQVRRDDTVKCTLNLPDGSERKCEFVQHRGMFIGVDYNRKVLVRG